MEVCVDLEMKDSFGFEEFSEATKLRKRRDSNGCCVHNDNDFKWTFILCKHNIEPSPKKFKVSPKFFSFLPDVPLTGQLFSQEQDVWVETLCSRQDGSVNQLRQGYKQGALSIL